ncbi:unnamed protein product [Moneuplotes crassus]|uniref:Uncharacterized protein n=1 Tax=Euplotes crassus TaxID=5936 RepID=A0AAD1XT14_EUPCR|nr:unnamed protein product [Moneuplotes crassus]
MRGFSSRALRKANKITKANKNQKGSLSDKKLKLRAQDKLQQENIKNPKKYLSMKENIVRKAPVVIPPILLAGGIISTGVFLHRITLTNCLYYSKNMTNAFNHYFLFQSHIFAVFAGSFIGAELLNFHEPLAIKHMRKGRRFYFPLIIMGLFTLALHMYDHLSEFAFIPFTGSITILLTLILICRQELALSYWNYKMMAVYAFPIFAISILSNYMFIRRQSYLENNKRVIEKYKSKFEKISM